MISLAPRKCLLFCVWLSVVVCLDPFPPLSLSLSHTLSLSVCLSVSLSLSVSLCLSLSPSSSFQPTTTCSSCLWPEAENEPHEGKRKCETLWPVFRYVPSCNGAQEGVSCRVSWTGTPLGVQHTLALTLVFLLLPNRIHHQKSRYIFDLYFKRKAISKGGAGGWLQACFLALSHNTRFACCCHPSFLFLSSATPSFLFLSSPPFFFLISL